MQLDIQLQTRIRSRADQLLQKTIIQNMLCPNLNLFEKFYVTMHTFCHVHQN